MLPALALCAQCGPQGGLAFDIGLDPVDGGYQFQTFLRNRSSTGFGHVMEFTARMRPAIGKLHVLTGAL